MSSLSCRQGGVSQNVLENLGHVVDGHDQDRLSSLLTLSHSFTGRGSYDRKIISTPCRIRPRTTRTTGLCIKSWLVQTFNSVIMLVPKIVWWLMEWVCRWLWALYPPTMDFLKYPHFDPIEVAMALNPSRMPHWGRLWPTASGHKGTFLDWSSVSGVIIQSFIVDPDSLLVFTLCTDLDCGWDYGQTAQTPQEGEGEKGSSLHLYRPPCTRGLRRVASICTSTKAQVRPKHEMRNGKVWLSRYTVHAISSSRWCPWNFWWKCNSTGNRFVACGTCWRW